MHNFPNRSVDRFVESNKILDIVVPKGFRKQFYTITLQNAELSVYRKTTKRGTPHYVKDKRSIFQTLLNDISISENELTPDDRKDLRIIKAYTICVPNNQCNILQVAYHQSGRISIYIADGRDDLHRVQSVAKVSIRQKSLIFFESGTTNEICIKMP